MSAPELWWWHLEQELTVAAGVERARRILAFIPAPPNKRPPGARHEITGDDNRVRLVTDDLRVIVKCLPRGGGRVLTIVIAAGNQGAGTEGVMVRVRDVMRSGNFNDLLE
jgi:hypothetical protein